MVTNKLHHIIMYTPYLKITPPYPHFLNSYPFANILILTWYDCDYTSLHVSRVSRG